MTDTKEQPTEPKCSKRHFLLVEDCPYCVSVRAFLERRVLNAALTYVTVKKHYRISVSDEMLKSQTALYSAVDGLKSSRWEKGQPEAPSPLPFKKTSDATGLEYSGKGGKKA